MTTAVPERSALVIGLGAMGGAMAATLVHDGWQVEGFDPSPEARAAATRQGVTTVDAIAASEASAVLLSLPSAEIVRATVPQVIQLPRLRVIVDTTTSDPTTSRELSDTAAAAGFGFVDAPVSGGRTGAATGALTSFVGGTDASVDAATPLLETLTGGRWKRIGGPGAGNVVKLLNNVLAATTLAAVGEAMDVAAAYDVDLSVAAEAISAASGGSRVTSAMLPDWVLSGTFDSGFTLGLMARDVGLALEVARAAGAAPQLLASTDDAWQRALQSLGPAVDFVEITGAVATATDALDSDRLRARASEGGLA